MRRLKFLLINPTAPVWRVRPGEKPRGPKVFRFSMLPSLSVAAAMPTYVDTQILDEDLEAIDYDTDADLIGISFMTYNAPRAYEIADKFRKEKGKTVIFGGYHPTFMRDEAIQHADAICIGEAEDNVPRMIEDFVAGRLQPFYESAPVDLTGLPIPDRTLIKGRSYVTPDVIQATRGCPYRCKFCSITAFHHHNFRMRPIGEVIEEIKTLGRYVLFMDDNIFGDKDYARELFTAMASLKKKWFSQSTIRIVDDPDLLQLASRSGCSGMFVGLESLSQKNLDASYKRINRAAEFNEAIETFHEAGIAIHAGFVFGMEHDTAEVFEETLDFLLDSNIDVLQATNLTPFPGTPLFDELDAEGRIFSKNWTDYDFGHVVFEPQNMSPDTLERGTAWVLTRFYDRKPVARRAWRAVSYLGPMGTVRSVLPLNIGYRKRFIMNGMFEKGNAFRMPEEELVG